MSKEMLKKVQHDARGQVQHDIRKGKHDEKMGF